MFFGSEFLDIVIGLIMVYLLLSLLVSSLNELIMSVFTSKRGEVLYTAIRTMLSDDFNPKQSKKKQDKQDKSAKTVDPDKADLGVQFYQHPLIVKFARNKQNSSEDEKHNRPSYLNKANFSKILIDILDDPEAINRDFTQLAERIKAQVPEGPTRTSLLTFVREAQGDVDKLDKLLQQWYDDMMERASGWYKRHVQKVLLILGFVTSVAIDADTFSIADKLANDPEAREKIVQLANTYISSQTKKDTVVQGIPAAGTTQADTGSSTAAAPPVTNAQAPSNTVTQTVSTLPKSRIDSINGAINDLVTDELYEAREILGMGWEIPKYKDISAKLKKDKPGKNQTWAAVQKYSDDLFHAVIGQLSIQKFIGWLITALAITLGAPFWFDILKKVVNVRNTGSKPDSEKQEAKN